MVFHDKRETDMEIELLLKLLQVKNETSIKYFEFSTESLQNMQLPIIIFQTCFL